MEDAYFIIVLNNKEHNEERILHYSCIEDAKIDFKIFISLGLYAYVIIQEVKDNHTYLIDFWRQDN